MARATTKRKTAEKSKTARPGGSKTRAAATRQEAHKSGPVPDADASKRSQREPADKTRAKSPAKKAGTRRATVANVPPKSGKSATGAVKRKTAPRKPAAKPQTRSGGRRKRA